MAKFILYAFFGCSKSSLSYYRQSRQAYKPHGCIDRCRIFLLLLSALDEANETANSIRSYILERQALISCLDVDDLHIYHSGTRSGSSRTTPAIESVSYLPQVTSPHLILPGVAEHARAPCSITSARPSPDTLPTPPSYTSWPPPPCRPPHTLPFH